jgi:hypothetical protein
LSLMLTRGIEVLAGAALVVAMLAVLHPAVAEAQSMSATQDDARRGTNRAAADAAPAARVVVRPGDSLWSISEQRLGPKATSRQIANAAERIYALNRDQIGADPNLIFPGQRLLVPPVAGATPARNATEPARKNPTVRATERAPDRTPNPTVGKADPKTGEAPDAVSERAHLPDMARPAPVLAARPVAPSDTSRPPGESLIGKARAAVSAAASMVAGLAPRHGYQGHQLLGAALLTVSSALALVLLLHVRRELAVRRPAERRARKVRGNHATFDPLLREGNSRVGDGIPTAHSGNGTYPAGIFAPVRRRQRQRLRRRRLQSSARQVRRGLSHGAYSPHVRRTLRRRRMGRQ